MVDTRGEYQELFNIYWPIGVAVFLVVAAAITLALIRSRRRDDRFRDSKADSDAEKLYAGGLVVVVAALVFFTYQTMSDLEEASSGEFDSSEVEAEVLDIDVTAARWSWRFDYPELGITQLAGTVGTEPLVVPTDTPVRFTLTSLDVQHAFFIPELRFKRDAFPDGETVFALAWDAPGRSYGHCAEYCGLLHSEHTFDVRALSPAEFETWAERETVADREADLPTSLR